jgi:protein subunit release factor B
MKFSSLIKEQLGQEDIENTIKYLKNQLDQVQLEVQSTKKKKEELEKQNKDLLNQVRKDTQNKQEQTVGVRKKIKVNPLQNPNRVANNI